MIDDDDPFAPDIEDDDGQEPAPGEPDSAADAKRIKRQERKIDRDKREGDEFWRSVFASPVGRREMWAVLVAAGIRSERFGISPAGFPDSHATFFRLGVQTVGRDLLETWDAREHEGVYLMRCEHDHKYAKAKMPPKKAAR